MNIRSGNVTDIEKYSQTLKLKMLMLPLKDKSKAYLLKNDERFDYFLVKDGKIQDGCSMAGTPSQVWKYAVNVALNLESKVEEGVCFIEEVYKAFLKYAEGK